MIRCLFTLLVFILPVGGVQAGPSSATLLDHLKGASRELKPLLDQLEELEWAAEGELKTLVARLEDRYETFEKQLGKNLFDPEESFQKLLARAFGEWRGGVPPRGEPPSEEDLLRMGLEVESLEIRREKAEEQLRQQDLPAIATSLWTAERRLVLRSLAILSGELLAATRMRAEAMVAKTRMELQEATLRLDEEKRRLLEEIAMLQGEAIDPLLKKLKETLLSEKILQIDQYLEGLRLKIGGEKITAELSQPELDWNRLFQMLRRERARLKTLLREREVVAKKKGLFEKELAALKEGEFLKTHQADSLGSAMKVPPEVEEKLKISQEIVTLAATEEVETKTDAERQERVVRAIETRIGEIPAIRPLVQKIKGAETTIRQAIQTVLQFVNSLIPKNESSRPRPERLIPPKGSLGSDLVIPFTKTEPASIFRAISSAFPRSLVQRLAPNP